MLEFVRCDVTLEIDAKRSDNVRLSGVTFVCFARAKGVIAERFPAGVVQAQWQIFPEATEFVITLVAELAVDLAGASRSVRHDFFNLVFEGIFGGIRQRVFNVLQQRHVAVLEHVEMEKAHFLGGNVLKFDHEMIRVVVLEANH